MTYAIERNIPLPVARRSAPATWPFDRMEQGDSVLIPAEKASSARKAASKFGAYNGRLFTTETQPDGSVLIWRIA